MREIGVIIPCYNEAAAIGAVVAGMRAALPQAAIYVYDNNSADGTRRIAAAAGATVRSEAMQGKGHVIRRAFSDIEADIYVLIDGDDTYDAASAARLIALMTSEGLDMVCAARVSDIPGAYRRGHVLGNRVLAGMVRLIFGDRIRDMLSGYRVFSRRFVKSFPALSAGFETETEFTVHALALHMPVGELDTAYKDRPPGSASKLRTVRDGWAILMTIVLLVKEYRPLAFFGAAAGALLLAGVALAVPVVVEFSRSGLVPRLPTAVLSTGLVLLSFLSLSCGLVLDSVARGRLEIKRLAYLSVPGVLR